MDTTQLQLWIDQNQFLALLGIILLSFIGFFIARFIIARGLVYIAKRTETNYDDIIVRHLRPFRVAWLAPVVVIYIFADLFPANQTSIEQAMLFNLMDFDYHFQRHIECGKRYLREQPWFQWNQHPGLFGYWKNSNHPRWGHFQYLDVYWKIPPCLINWTWCSDGGFVINLPRYHPLHCGQHTNLQL